MLEKRREKRQRKHRLDNLTELTELKLHTAAASTVGRGPQCLFEGLFVKLPTLAKRVQYVDWTRLDIYLRRLRRVTFQRYQITAVCRQAGEEPYV